MFRGLYIGNNKMFILPHYGGKLYTPADDMSLTPALLIDGYYEKGLTHFIQQHVHAGQIVIDIGANLGYFSVLLGNRVGTDGQVLAIEPNPFMFEFLKDNITINDLHVQIQPLNCAISSENNNVVKFNVSERYRGNSSLVAHTPEYFNHFYTDKINEIDVTCYTLDKLMFDKNAIIDFVKIDVEGGEPLVFQGMKCLLQYKRIKKIAFEWNRPMLSTNESEFKHILENLGAKFYRINQDGSIYEVSLDYIFSQDYIDNILAIIE